MTLLDAPIPPAPAEFTPAGAPPGVTADYTLFKSSSGSPWYASRPVITPRLLIVHTNAANGEASSLSQVNWGNAGPYTNTHPHYALNAPTPRKLVPTDRRAIANSTGQQIEDQYKERDVSFWSIAIETADAGGNNATLAPDGTMDYGDFLYNHAELVARIIAYESIVWGFPLEVPTVWNGEGVVTHTEPFPYPYYTTKAGKTCPTYTKKNRVLRGDILPRARQIKDRWTTTPKDDTMTDEQFEALTDAITDLSTRVDDVEASLFLLREVLSPVVVKPQGDWAAGKPWVTVDGSSVRWTVGELDAKYPEQFVTVESGYNDLVAMIPVAMIPEVS